MANGSRTSLRYRLPSCGFLSRTGPAGGQQDQDKQRIGGSQRCRPGVKQVATSVPRIPSSSAATMVRAHRPPRPHITMMSAFERGRPRPVEGHPALVLGSDNSAPPDSRPHAPPREQSHSAARLRSQLGIATSRTCVPSVRIAAESTSPRAGLWFSPQIKRLDQIDDAARKAATGSARRYRTTIHDGTRQ